MSFLSNKKSEPGRECSVAVSRPGVFPSVLVGLGTKRTSRRSLGDLHGEPVELRVVVVFVDDHLAALVGEGLVVALPEQVVPGGERLDAEAPILELDRRDSGDVGDVVVPEGDVGRRTDGLTLDVVEHADVHVAVRLGDEEGVDVVLAELVVERLDERTFGTKSVLDGDAVAGAGRERVGALQHVVGDLVHVEQCVHALTHEDPSPHVGHVGTFGTIPAVGAADGEQARHEGERGADLGHATSFVCETLLGDLSTRYYSLLRRNVPKAGLK